MDSFKKIFKVYHNPEAQMQDAVKFQICKLKYSSAEKRILLRMPISAAESSSKFFGKIIILNEGVYS